MKKDLCLTCGKEVQSDLWGGECEQGHETVHQEACKKCGKICGIIVDDDYCGIDNLICPNCMDNARQKSI